MGDAPITARLKRLQPFLDVALAGVDWTARPERKEAEMRLREAAEAAAPRTFILKPEQKAWKAEIVREIAETSVYHVVLERELIAARLFAQDAAQRAGIGWPAVATRGEQILATLRTLASTAADFADDEIRGNLQRMPERWQALMAGRTWKSLSETAQSFVLAIVEAFLCGPEWADIVREGFEAPGYSKVAFNKCYEVAELLNPCLKPDLNPGKPLAERKRAEFIFELFGAIVPTSNVPGIRALCNLVG